MECRPGCGACCIAPSINRPYFGMPRGKAAGEWCAHLDRTTMACAIWQTEHYPATCRQFAPHASVCGKTRQEAIRLLDALEHSTAPG